MPKVDTYDIPRDLVLGVRHNERVPHADQDRQRAEVKHILKRLRGQPGVVLADEVGMGKTFVALAAAYSIAWQSRRGPVIVMAPANLVDKWVQDLKTFCELYLDDRVAVSREDASPKEFRARNALRYGVARHSIDLMKLLDDKARERCHLIFLAQGAMGRSQTDKWIRLALIREALRRHGRGRAKRLIEVKKYIHRFVAELIWAIGKERASDWGDEVWEVLLKFEPAYWMDLYNASIRNSKRQLTDDPVPESIVEAMSEMDLKELAGALEQMPIRIRGGSNRMSDRITAVRNVLKAIERDLWKHLLAKARWRSPLLVMDEAHHLKNPATRLARQLQSPEADSDLRTGDGAMARAFDRMLFLTATPFQLGHQELVRVLERFGDVRWDTKSLGKRDEFDKRLAALDHSLTESQRSAVALQRCWSRLRPEEGPAQGDSDAWWQSLLGTSPEKMTPRQRPLVEAYRRAVHWRGEAEKHLRPWLIRYNKGERWSGTGITRRQRVDGAAIVANGNEAAGLEVPPDQLLPFYLAARSAVSPGKDLLGDALCSSYEAFRHTRESRRADRDDSDDEPAPADLTHSAWYLAEFDTALGQCSGSVHPKIAATVQKTVDLWESGEKILIFAFYRQTCRALRIHISQEIERRIHTLARRRLAGAGQSIEGRDISRILDTIHRRYFDDAKAPGRRALDRALQAILHRRQARLERIGASTEDTERMIDVMRRFLRVPTTLVRCFPIHKYETRKPHLAVRSMLDSKDASSMSWRGKFQTFIDFLVDRCSSAERSDYLEATARTQTGGIRVTGEDATNDDEDAKESLVTLANVQVATGGTRREARSRLMRAFNTPFFPDILVCSQVMGEGVDLQRYCRHVIHHDLAWNPSSIEQRTGRIDRLGCKAESRNSINIFLPYISGTADDRQYRVMTDREQWFRIVMGQDEVAKLIPCDDDREQIRLPSTFSQELMFDFSLKKGL